ncbi:Surfactin synthase subunit 1 [compost metagenome]
MGAKTIQQMLMKSFEDTPRTAIAIQKVNKQISYEECFQNAFCIQTNINRITANRMGKLCVVFMSDPEKVLLTALGVMFASCVFVPIDPKAPKERINNILSILDEGIVIYDNNDLISVFDDSWVCVDYCDLIENVNQLSDVEYSLELGSQPDEMLYLYFTSGTTGRPNAVAGRNKSLAHFISWEMQALNVQVGMRTSQLTDFSHDPFLRDIFLPLCSGGVICIPPDKQTILDGKRLAQWLEQSQIEIIHCTPGVFHILSSQDLYMNQFPNLKYILLAGASPSVKDLRQWYERVGHRIEFINLYGPTETTLAKMYHRITLENVHACTIPIGRPILDTIVHLIGENGKECQEEQIGEIVIRSPYCSLGYFNNKDLTRQRFEIEVLDNNTWYNYKTGDLGKKLSNGEIQFIGRKDRQFKIRGYRIEPEEIENYILSVEGVLQCAIKYFPQDEEGIDGSIIAYIAPETINIDSIQKRLEQGLPHYMLPVQYITMHTLKLNERGKVDSHALIDPRIIISSESHDGDNNIEVTLYNLWKDLLNIDRFDRKGHFFQLGGSSLNVMSLIYQIYEKLDVDISLEDIFTYPIFSDMAVLISNKLKDCSVHDDSNEKASIQVIEDMILIDNLIQRKDIPVTKIISSVRPFDSFFYRSCFYNSFFTVATYYQREVPSFLCNDIPFYSAKLNGTFGIAYQSMKDYADVMHEQGLQITSLAESKQFHESIINAISADTPVIIGIDCYYEPNRDDMYQRNHWYHFVCVVGYNIEEHAFYILEHEHVDSLAYEMIPISFEDLANCYSNGLRLIQADTTKNHLFIVKETSDYTNASACYQSYIAYVRTKKQELLDNVNILQCILSQCNGIMCSTNRLLTEGDMMIRNIQEIYQAKSVMVYLLTHFLGEEHPCMSHLNAINEIWKMVLLTCTEANLRKTLVINRWERIYKRMQLLEQEELNFIYKWLD